MCYNEVSVENEIILSLFAEKGPYNMTMWFVVPLIVTDTYSDNVFTDDHWYSTHIPRIVRVRTTQTTQKIRKTAQYCANFYAKPSFELLKTWNRVKHRYGEHRRTTAEVPRQKNWWNAQIADVSRKTRNLCVIHAFTRFLGSVTGP